MLLVSCHFPFKHPPKGDQGTPYCKKGYPRPHVAGEIAVCCSVSFITFLLHWGSRTPTLPSGQLAKKKKVVGQVARSSLSLFLPMTQWLMQVSKPGQLSDFKPKALQQSVDQKHAPRWLRGSQCQKGPWHGRTAQNSNPKGPLQDVKGPVSFAVFIGNPSLWQQEM